MKLLKFRIELLLTLACLGMIYSLATTERESTAPPMITVSAPGLAIAPAAAQDIRLTSTSYNLADKSHDQKTLNALAQEEAQRMIETGNVEEYQEELDKNGLLMSVLGY